MSVRLGRRRCLAGVDRPTSLHLAQSFVFDGAGRFAAVDVAVTLVEAHQILVHLLLLETNRTRQGVEHLQLRVTGVHQSLQVRGGDGCHRWAHHRPAIGHIFALVALANAVNAH